MQTLIGWFRQHIQLSHILFITLAGIGGVYPEQVADTLSEVNMSLGTAFNWLIVIACTGFLILCFVLAFSRYGAIRLGSQDEKPEFSVPSWLAMLFAAGMGTGLVFYGAAEPLLHMVAPPPGTGASALNAAMGQAAAARQSIVVTYLHWGLHAWATYTVCALCIAYFTFRQQQPMLAGSAVDCLWGEKAWSFPLLRLINLISVLAVVFGLVASLGQGIMQMSSGLNQVGIYFSSETTGYLVILLVLTGCYIASALTGLGKGIKILSDVNMLACIALMLFVLAVGPTHFIMETFATSLGDYASRFIQMGMNLRHYSHNEEWTQNWTITYFLWWIAWGPFVGVFIARISRGRTIKEFIMGVLFVPSLFSFLWFSTLGGTAISLDLFGGAGLGALAQQEPSTVTFALLDKLPLSAITSLITLFLIFIFLVTSADSGAYVLGMFTSHGNPNPPTFQKLFWGGMVAIVTAGLLIVAKDLIFIRAIAMAGAIPYMLIMILQCYALLRFLKKDVQTLQQPFVHLH